MEIVNLMKLLADNPPATFHSFHDFNGSPFGAMTITGQSQVWEMHPDTDEFFYIIDGILDIELAEDSGISFHTAPAGTTFVIPQGCWHRLNAGENLKMLYFTLGQSLHCADDMPPES